MRHPRPARRYSLSTLALLLPLAVSLTADELTPKGIYHAVDEHRRTGVKFFVELDEGAKPTRRVPVSHDFRTGDRLTFTFEINRDSYVYVINQTLLDPASPSGRRGSTTSSGLVSKRIERVLVDPSPPPPTPRPAPRPVPARRPADLLDNPRLLFPTTRAGINNRLKGDRPYRIPARGRYVMDDETGIEKLFVVISDRRLDLSGHFDAASGRIRGAHLADRLRRQLDDWRTNAEVELTTKGIVHVVDGEREAEDERHADGYGVSIDPAKPAVVEIDLRHCR